MFGRLLKHEWRSNAATLWILSACALGASILAAVMLRSLMELRADDNPFAAAGIGMTLMFLILGIFAYYAAVQIILLVRFYKNKFTDEGYLTFTLPVNSHQIFLSSLLNMFFWTLISTLVLILCLIIMVAIGVDPSEMSPSDPSDNAFDAMISNLPPAWLILIQILFGFLSGLITPMTCLTVGATVAKKHKILAAFGIYYVISMIASTVESIISVAFSQDFLDAGMSGTLDIMNQMSEYTTRVSIVGLLVQVVMATGCYFLSTYLMKRKLNLN